MTKQLEESIAQLNVIVSTQEGELRAAHARIAGLERDLAEARKPVPMRMCCERCGKLHVDEGEFVTKVHHTHACQYCGAVWRPAIVPTVGVQFLPGFKNEETTP